MSRLRIAVLGAPQTGKTRLAQELGSALNSDTGYAVLDNPAFPPADTAGDGPWSLVLLTGLDLPEMGPHQRQADQALRQKLTLSNLPYTTVYGRDAQRSANALQAIRFHLREPTTTARTPSRWRWPCEKCSDPECEHRLFNDLLQPK
jgi:hypothetical protein